MSALVERIIAARDRLRPLRVQSEDYFKGAIGEAVDALAEAGNRIHSLEQALSDLLAVLDDKGHGVVLERMGKPVPLADLLNTNKMAHVLQCARKAAA